MRHLLTIGAGAVLVLAATAADQADPQPASAHSGHPVLAVQFHPASNLGCGWHYNCDGVLGDNPAMGLDWNPCTGCATTVYLRLRIVLGSGTEARGDTISTPWLGCPFARVTTIKRLADNAPFGQIIQLHTKGPSTYYENFVVGDNTAVTGSMVPFPNDPCAGWTHVMQWYESGPYDSGWSQNLNGWPTEAQCTHWSNPPCNQGHPVWNTSEYNFTFTS